MGIDEQTVGVGQALKPKPTNVEIRKLVNGFVIRGFGVEEKIANTLDEALALVRKDLN